MTTREILLLPLIGKSARTRITETALTLNSEIVATYRDSEITLSTSAR